MAGEQSNNGIASKTHDNGTVPRNKVCEVAKRATPGLGNPTFSSDTASFMAGSLTRMSKVQTQRRGRIWAVDWRAKRGSDSILMKLALTRG